MIEGERNQELDPLRQFGKGDLRYLESVSKEETIANVYAYLDEKYKAMGISLTPDQMIEHVIDRVGLNEQEIERVFPSLPKQTQDERENQIYKRFLSLAYTDSKLIPGALKQFSRKPAEKWGGKNIIDMLSNDQDVDEFTYSSFKLFDAEMTSG